MDNKKNLAVFNPVLDENGNPKVFYHGTNKKDFSEFKLPGHKGTGGNAIFVSEDPKTAAYFTHSAPGSRIYPVYVSADNLFDHTNPEHASKLSQFVSKNHNKLFPGALYGPEVSAKWAEQGDYGVLEHPEVTKWMKKQGHDGFYVREGVGRPQNIALFNPSNIKSAISNTGEYDKTNPDITKAEGGAVDLSQYQDKTGFGLYSHAAETAAALPQAKGTPDQMKSMLMKQGVKPAEIEHSNYDDVFGKRPSVTKDELVQHFRQSMPTIKEHVLGGEPTDKQIMEFHDISPEFWNSLSAEDTWDLVNQYKKYANSSKFEQYSMPGGENYREVLLQLERNENNYERQAGEVYRKKSDLVAAYDKLPPGDPRGPEMSQQIVALQREYNQLLDKANENQQVGFKSGHWDQPDVLAHLRMKDRTGPNGEKILHVDEIQSDWGQSGRGGNFQNTRANEEFEQYVKDLREKLYQQNVKSLVDNKVREENKPPILAAMRKSIEETSPEQVAKYLGYNTWAEFDDKREKLYRNAKLPPHGPYVTNTAAWTDLALKRALHEAAAGGYDKMIFTPGEEQANRYDLSNYINSIYAFPDVNGKIHLNLHDNDNPDDYPLERLRDIDPNDLHKYVGKEVAQRIMDKIEFPIDKEVWQVAHRQNGGVHIYGDDLESIEDARKVVSKVPSEVVPHLEITSRKRRVGGKNAVLHDLDLKVGGEGMKAFYDKLVPKQLMEITKRHDPEVKIKPDVIDTPEGPKDVHAIDITPKLRKSVLRGQKAFAEGGAVDDDGITAYHGSPHDFDKFDISKIGTGEGAQAYGHGLYFAQAEPTAREYRDTLTDRASNFRVGNIDMPKWILRSIEMAPDRNVAIANHKQEFEKRLAEAEAASQGSHQPWLAAGQKAAIKDVLDGLDALERGADLPHTRGRMYEVRINAHPDHFLDWDMPIYKQPEHVQNAVQKSLDLAASQGISGKKSLAGRTVNSSGNTIDADPDEFLQHDGASIQYMLQRVLGAKGATDVLHANGIKGIKYFDANSRTPPPNLDPDHVKRQIERNRAQAAQTIDEAHRADLDDDHQILLNRLAKAEKARARNYVVFDDKLVGVKRKYAYGGSVAA